MAFAPGIKKGCLYYKVCENAALQCKVENQTYEYRSTALPLRKQ
ncbi:MAG: hypothetical protein QXJ68_08295 [Methanocellales archaeon]